MDIRDVPTGESWGCRYKIRTFVDDQGTPVQAQNLQVGQSHPGTPGEYTGIGVIQVRDIERELVQLQDVETLQQHTVSFADIWDLDTIEWVEDQTV